IFPDKSAWWRSSMWRLGVALQADGKEPEALEAYVKSYSIDKPDLGRYTIVEALYKKLNGSTEGLEAKVGRSPIAQVPPTEVAKNIVPPGEGSSTVASPPPPSPVPKTSPATATATPAPSPLAEPSLTPTPSPEATAKPTPAPSADATP